MTVNFIISAVALVALVVAGVGAIFNRNWNDAALMLGLVVIVILLTDVKRVDDK